MNARLAPNVAFLKRFQNDVKQSSTASFNVKRNAKRLNFPINV